MRELGVLRGPQSRGGEGGVCEVLLDGEVRQG